MKNLIFVAFVFICFSAQAQSYTEYTIKPAYPTGDYNKDMQSIRVREYNNGRADVYLQSAENPHPYVPTYKVEPTPSYQEVNFPTYNTPVQTNYVPVKNYADYHPPAYNQYGQSSIYNAIFGDK